MLIQHIEIKTKCSQPPSRWTMLKQWLVNDGKTDSITVEEKYVKWTEELRSDKYATVPLLESHVLT